VIILNLIYLHEYSEESLIIPFDHPENFPIVETDLNFVKRVGSLPPRLFVLQLLKVDMLELSV
jgi:hypothetical protein